MRARGNTILVTGGGSGIGRALAHRLHDAGNRVVVAGRRADVLAETAAGRAGIATLAGDLSDAAGVAAFARDLLAAHPDLNVLVNNAGVMQIEEIGAARDLSAAEATIAINLLGPIRLVDALVDHLGGQADAAIINVTSGLAFVPLTAAATYSATKAALHSYSVSLRDVLAGRIEVIELAPPAVRTELTPGQSAHEGYMPLDDFAAEAAALLLAQPTPAEVMVERVRPLRTAERDGRFDAALAEINGFAHAERERAG